MLGTVERGLFQSFKTFQSFKASRQFKVQKVQRSMTIQLFEALWGRIFKQ